MVKIKEKFIVNRKGNKLAVIINLKTYKNLIEELRNLQIIAERMEESV